METARPDPPSPASPAADAAPPPPVYCRRCGYSLRGLPTGKCPECGHAFDLADRKTYARRPPRSRLRRWAWRLSLLALVLALAAAAVPGWYGWEWRAERRSIDTIRGLGGEVRTRQVEAGGLGRWLPERWAFLRERASYVWLHDLTAEQAARLDLRPLGRLERLDLIDCHVGDSALAPLGGMAELKVLYLDGNPLDGSGLAHLAGCRRLESLTLAGTRLTDAGLAPVGRLTSLRGLTIGRTAVTDAGLASLAGLTSLEWLDLSGTAVTDAGLAPLRGLTALRVVYLNGTRVTEQGNRDLRKALPNARIVD